MKLALYTAATKGYGHALVHQARRIIAGLTLERRVTETLFLLVTDDATEVEPARALYEAAGVRCEVLMTDREGGENYQVAAQLLIASMRQAAATRAQAWGADACLALDSDVLPPANAIRCMLDMLEFDGGFYGVAFCPYPSQGGGAFLGGHGSPRDPIFADFSEEEKDVPQELLDRREELRKALSEPGAAESLREELSEAERKIREVPPKWNVFEANGKKWRRRGWFDFAYPALGRGAVVPVDWIGFGCTMMGRHALALCDFTGYDGRGTEDLYICYRRWAPAGIRIACIPHCPCDHVIRDKENGGHVLVATGHADDEEHAGHLRQWRVPWEG